MKNQSLSMGLMALVASVLSSVVALLLGAFLAGQMAFRMAVENRDFDIAGFGLKATLILWLLLSLACWTALWALWNRSKNKRSPLQTG